MLTHAHARTPRGGTERKCQFAAGGSLHENHGWDGTHPSSSGDFGGESCQPRPKAASLSSGVGVALGTAFRRRGDGVMEQEMQAREAAHWASTLSSSKLL